MKVKVWCRLGLVAALVVVQVGCGGSEKYAVEIRYTLNPVKSLPPGMSAVAVLPAELGPATDAKWSDIASSVVQRVLRETKDAHNLPLDVNARKEMPKLMAEEDLAAAGITSSTSPGSSGAVQKIEGIITSEIGVIVDVVEGRSSTVDPDIGGIMDAIGGRNTGRDTFRQREVATTARTMTVDTEFNLIDSRTGKIWESFSHTYQGTEESDVSPFFGHTGTMADLEPTDRVIGTLVEQGAREFVGRFFPRDVATVVEIKSSGNEACQAGVRAMKMEEYAEALSHFKTALAEKPDDYRAAFAAGVTCELLGSYEEALNYYKRAAAQKDRDEFLAAKTRLAGHISRIARK